LPRPLLGQLQCRYLPQFVVDQRQQLLGSVQVALLNLVQNPCHFVPLGSPASARPPKQRPETAQVNSNRQPFEVLAAVRLPRGLGRSPGGARPCPPRGRHWLVSSLRPPGAEDGTAAPGRRLIG